MTRRTKRLKETIALSSCLLAWCIVGAACQDSEGGYVVRNDTSRDVLVARETPGATTRVVRVAPAGHEGVAFVGGPASEIVLLDPGTCRVLDRGSFSPGFLLLLVVRDSGFEEAGARSPDTALPELPPTDRCSRVESG
jgi:hypothetical protein